MLGQRQWRARRRYRHHRGRSTRTAPPSSSAAVRLYGHAQGNRVQFDPSAASSSKSELAAAQGTLSSKRDSFGSATTTTAITALVLVIVVVAVLQPRAAREEDAPSGRLLFAEGASIKTPACALGDFGRRKRGLFLVLHSDDVHLGGERSGARSGDAHHAKVIATLKELYSAPGGGGGGGSSGASSGEAAAIAAAGTRGH